MAWGERRGSFPWRVHPIWRGIGFAFLVIVPLIAYGLVEAMLPMLEGPLPGIFGEVQSLPLVGEVDAFLGRIFATFILSIVILLLLSILGSFLYSLLGGDRQESQAKMLKRDRYRR